MASLRRPDCGEKTTISKLFLINSLVGLDFKLGFFEAVNAELRRSHLAFGNSDSRITLIDSTDSILVQCLAILFPFI